MEDGRIDAIEDAPVKEEVVSIKETLELLDGLEVVVKFVAKVMEDGVLGGSDLMHLQVFLKDFDVMKDSVTGIELILKEGKDLDQLEVMEIITKLAGIFKVLKTIKFS